MENCCTTVYLLKVDTSFFLKKLNKILILIVDQRNLLQFVSGVEADLFQTHKNLVIIN